MTTVLGMIGWDSSSQNRYDMSNNLVDTISIIWGTNLIAIDQRADGTLKRFVYYDSSLREAYEYNVENGNWYIGNVLYNGPPPTQENLL